MDRKQLLGFGLILILLGIWLYLNQPTEAERLEIERRRDSLNRIENQERTPISTDTSMERSEEHTSELQSRGHLVCRLLLEKTNIIKIHDICRDKSHTYTQII